MGLTLTKVENADILMVNLAHGDGVTPLLQLTRAEARTLAAQLLDESRTDVDHMRARARRGKTRTHLGEREAWENVDQLLDEIEALRSKVRGDVAW